MAAPSSPTPPASTFSVALATAYGLLGVGTLVLLVGSYIGLFASPPDRYMGDVQRIMYVHVPTAWMGLLAFTAAVVAAVAFLVKPSWRWDSVLEATLEVGVLLAFLLCVQGSLWARPTWGVWWDWDPRLTTTAVMLLSFGGIVALRHFVEDPIRRATWSSVSTIIAYANVPIVYLSVRWWNSLHQVQSSAATMDKSLAVPLRINAIGMLFFVAGLVLVRAVLASRRREVELAPPPGRAPAGVA